MSQKKLIELTPAAYHNVITILLHSRGNYAATMNASCNKQLSEEMHRRITVIDAALKEIRGY